MSHVIEVCYSVAVGERTYFVYILGSKTGTLYTGVTNNLERRVFEHRQGVAGSFTQKYRVTLLLFYEEFSYIEDAIRREKEIKGWRRHKKDALIASVNPRLEDLAADWFTSE